MKTCEYVVKQSSPADPSFVRCTALAAPQSRYCEQHDQFVRENPMLDAQQRPFRLTR